MLKFEIEINAVGDNVYQGYLYSPNGLEVCRTAPLRTKQEVIESFGHLMRDMSKEVSAAIMRDVPLDRLDAKVQRILRWTQGPLANLGALCFGRG